MPSRYLMLKNVVYIIVLSVRNVTIRFMILLNLTHLTKQAVKT